MPLRIDGEDAGAAGAHHAGREDCFKPGLSSTAALALQARTGAGAMEVFGSELGRGREGGWEGARCRLRVEGGCVYMAEYDGNQ